MRSPLAYIQDIVVGMFMLIIVHTLLVTIVGDRKDMEATKNILQGVMVSRIDALVLIILVDFILKIGMAYVKYRHREGRQIYGESF